MKKSIFSDTCRKFYLEQEYRCMLYMFKHFLRSNEEKKLYDGANGVNFKYHAEVFDRSPHTSISKTNKDSHKIIFN